MEIAITILRKLFQQVITVPGTFKDYFLSVLIELMVSLF